MSSKKAALKVSERDATLNPRQLRTAGYTPIILYGKGTPSVQLQVRTHEFTQQLAHGLKEFQLEGFHNGQVRIQQLQVDSVHQKLLSAELMAV